MQQIKSFEFDPLKIVIYDEEFYFPNIDVAMSFITELEAVIEGALSDGNSPPVKFEEGTDYDMEEIPFYLTAQEAMDAAISGSRIKHKEKTDE